MAGKLLCLTLLVSIAGAVMAGDEDGCYIKEINKYVPVGAVVTPIGKCVTMTCTGKGSVSSLTCPDEVSLNPKCHRTGVDLSVSYPACCPRFICQ